ncbi:putative enzyme related to lactoylglutathione lyase [Pseudonocardia eucalypti]|nr:putative enzyme related to lactoylglutathione lyase [Pseudonocardia eucalypti]
MTIQRIVPNLKVAEPGLGHAFYQDVLGLRKDMDLGWIATFRAPGNPAAQLSLVTRDASAPEDSVISVGVPDVEAVHERALALGHPIVHPLTTEPWGVRRFFVREPNGYVVNVVMHAG